MKQHSILLFISSLSSGGAERVTANLANHWARKGWQVTIVTLADRSADFYELAPAISRIGLGMLKDGHNLLAGIVNNLQRVLVLRRVLRKVSPEMALAMMDKSNILLAIAAYRLPGMIVLGSERIHPPQQPLSQLWARLRYISYRNLATVVALTTETRDWLLRNSRAKKIAVIPNAVSWPLPAHHPFCIPKEILPPNGKTLLAVGRLEEQKGFDLLIEAFCYSAFDHPGWNLAILGDGPLRSSLAEQIKRSGLENRIYLAGRVGNIGDWYKAADLFVLSSRFEGFPNTLVEAMAHGLPVVSFDCDTGPRDIIRHDVDGLLVTNGDVVALGDALGRLMADEALCQRFGTKAIEVRERFSMEKIAGMWEDLFFELTEVR
jgi:glycosyltransferase involved in cell wall biosynthesis